MHRLITAAVAVLALAGCEAVRTEAFFRELPTAPGIWVAGVGHEGATAVHYVTARATRPGTGIILGCVDPNGLAMTVVTRQSRGQGTEVVDISIDDDEWRSFEFKRDGRTLGYARIDAPFFRSVIDAKETIRFRSDNIGQTMVTAELGTLMEDTLAACGIKL